MTPAFTLSATEGGGRAKDVTADVGVEASPIPHNGLAELPAVAKRSLGGATLPTPRDA